MARQQVPDRDLTLGDFVLHRRRANHLTQAQLGELASVGRRFVVELEKGKPTLRLDKVNAVLAVFGKTLGIVPAARRGAPGPDEIGSHEVAP